ncbi:MAG: DegT/DnrJ/EryC1/StrS family aminotransferase, partial [Lachnospiraceae bacterium]|nr:DegT/DnrJ/EryC1/StrS family aminotransferase [Lachnospiraceae bacterium]
MQVEYTVLKRNFELYEKEYRAAYERAFTSGWYILGPELEAFEKAFAEYVGCKY